MKKIYLGFLILITISFNAFSHETIFSNIVESNSPSEVIYSIKLSKYIVVDKPYWTGIKVVRDGDYCITTTKVLISSEIVEVQGLNLVKRKESNNIFKVKCLSYLPEDMRDLIRRKID